MDKPHSDHDQDNGDLPAPANQGDLKEEQADKRPKAKGERVVAWTNRYGSAIDLFFNFIITVFTAVVGVVAIYQWPLAVRALEETRKSNEIAHEDMRPYLALGDHEGRVAEYTPPKEGQAKGRLFVFVTNHGKRVAERVDVPAHASGWRANQPESMPPEEHHHWYRIWQNGQVVSSGGWLSTTLGPGAVMARRLPEESTPNEAQWGFTGGLTGPALRIDGTIEYCDGRQWHCERFTIYRIRGTDDFEPISEPFRPCSTDKRAPALQPGQTLEWLSPCALREDDQGEAAQ